MQRDSFWGITCKSVEQQGKGRVTPPLNSYIIAKRSAFETFDQKNDHATQVNCVFSGESLKPKTHFAIDGYILT